MYVVVGCNTVFGARARHINLGNVIPYSTTKGVGAMAHLSILYMCRPGADSHYHVMNSIVSSIVETSPVQRDHSYEATVYQVLSRATLSEAHLPHNLVACDRYIIIGRRSASDGL